MLCPWKVNIFLILRTLEQISTKCLYYIKINLSLLIFVSLSTVIQHYYLSLSRFALLKILQKFGSLERFDYLYHKAGPDMGKPRGYCFVSYLTRQVSFEYRYTLKVDICSFFSYYSVVHILSTKIVTLLSIEISV